VRHEAKGNHNFPPFDSNSELILKASRPDGLVAVGTRPNPKSDVLFVTIKLAPEDPLGLENTVCFAKFSRKELTIGEGNAAIVQDRARGKGSKVEDKGVSQDFVTNDRSNRWRIDVLLLEARIFIGRAKLCVRCATTTPV
jgi:hypothetical protein